MTKPAQLAGCPVGQLESDCIALSPFENYYYSFMCYYLGIKKTPAPAALAKTHTHEAARSAAFFCIIDAANSSKNLANL